MTIKKRAGYPFPDAERNFGGVRRTGGGPTSSLCSSSRLGTGEGVTCPAAGPQPLTSTMAARARAGGTGSASGRECEKDG